VRIVTVIGGMAQNNYYTWT